MMQIFKKVPYSYPVFTMRVYLCVVFYFFAHFSMGQYYSTGQNASSIRWKQINTSEFQLIFPDFFEPKAMQYAAFLDSVAIFDTFRLQHTPIKVPIILYTQNLQSNGMVAWAPKRMELITNPPENSFAVPWEKQLIIHEYRHVMQINKLNQGFTRGLSYIIGEQGVGLMSGFVPKWFLEGDATVAETQLTTFGRGKQPDFSLEYRANIGENQKPFTYDQIMFGSYKKHVPNIYQHGYWMVSTGETLFGMNFWDTVMDFAGRKPYLFWNFTYGMIKNSGLNKGDLHRKTFSYLKSYFDTIPQQNNSGKIIPTQTTSYTNYLYPLYINDTLIIAFKTDLQQTNRLVAINPQTETERILIYTGIVSSQPSIHNQTIIRTEARPHIRWEQKNYSCIRTYNLQTGEDILFKNGTSDFSPVFIHLDTIACIAIDSLSNSNIVLKTGEKEIKRFSFHNNNITNITFDTSFQQIAFIALNEKGMWIGILNYHDGTITPLTAPSFITIRSLSSDKAGNLYFSSSNNGIEEIHQLNIVTQQEYVLTTSRYGSSKPYATQNNLFYSSYTLDGYRIAYQPANEYQHMVSIVSNKPQKEIVPPFSQWNILNVDSISFDSDKTYPTSPYRKLSHTFNFHSWMPFYAMDVATEQQLTSLGWGATLLSQNILNTLSMTTAYGRVNKNNVWHTKFTYSEFFPVIEWDVKYGGGKQMIYGKDQEDITFSLKNYFATTANISVPLNFSQKNKQIFLIPNTSISYSNALIYTDDLEIEGYVSNNTGIYFQNQWTKVLRDIFPRWGMAFQANIASAPFQEEFGTNYMAYARFYFPGFVQNHGWMLRGSVQKQKTSNLNFSTTYLFPRELQLKGAPEDLLAFSADYSMPVWYPDFNWAWIFYFKRLYFNLFTDYSLYHYESYDNANNIRHTEQPWSAGIDINIELVFLRIGFPSVFDFRFTQTSEGFKFGLGFTLNFGG